ncbi:hypothetical protein NLI96_g11946 [Meripilus lineatus]|uniref:Cryptic loci regulator 2 C-terminal domain-containing protein n=1 Tax=Meripilus lineatus TaxID=2056292 RepID=A0AAD5UVS0_9APHY|nr:hypothetical protein NLI96_g11946 [Physisporinus lineatus]
MGLPIHRAAGGSPSPSAAGGSVSAPRRPKAPKATAGVERVPREPKPKDVKPYAGVRKVPPKPAKKLTGPSTSITPDRDKDIVASLADGEITPPRMFRKGELVWCHLDPPIPGLRGPETDIAFWPSIVESTTLRSEPVQKEGSAGETSQAAISIPNTDWNKAPFPPPNAPQPPITWSIRQHNLYKLKLLGTPYVCTVYDEDVLPYLIYAPSNILLSTIREALEDTLRTSTIEELDKTKDLMFDFNPHGSDDENAKDPKRFMQAVGPITLAIEISANVLRCWTPTDEWDMQIVVPAVHHLHPSPGSPSGGGGIGLSLQSAIMSAMKSNSGQTGSGKGEGSATANGSSEQTQPQEPDPRLPGVVPKAIPQTITQLRYQGLWWGTERIWADELVRLKLARRQFAPKGTDMIYPPAGSSQSVPQDANNAGEEEPLDAEGPADKGLFMKVEGMFVVDIPQPSGTVIKECRVSGMLYEIVNEDWEEPPPPGTSATQAPNDNGKGKGRALDVGAANNTQENGGEGISSGTTHQTQAPSSSSAGPHISQTQPQSGSNGMPSSTQLPATQPSRPMTPQERSVQEEKAHPVLKVPYGLPRAPRGFKFRPILSPGHEVVISLSLISGRYYPGLFDHPLLIPMIDQAVRTSLSTQDGLFAYRHLWAMQGLLPGAYQSMDPVEWVGNRALMLKRADSVSRDAFRELIDHMKRHKQQGLLGPPAGGDAEMVDAFVPEQGGSISAAA